MLKDEIRIIIESAVDTLILRIKEHKKLNIDGIRYEEMKRYLYADFEHGGFIFGDFYSAIYKGCGIVFYRYVMEMMFDVFFNKISSLGLDSILKQAMTGTYINNLEYTADIDSKLRILLLSVHIKNADVTLKRVTSYKKFIQDSLENQLDKSYLYIEQVRQGLPAKMINMFSKCYRWVCVPESIGEAVPYLRRELVSVRDDRFGIGLSKRV